MKKQSILGSAIMILLFTYVPTSITVTPVWAGNDDVKIYEFNGNYISQFGAGYEYPGDIDVVP